MQQPTPALKRAAPLRLAPIALSLALALGTAMPTLAYAADNGRAVALSIAAQPLGTALNEVAAVAGVSVAFSSALVAGKTAPAVQGTMTATQAIDKMLVGTGLRATSDGNTIVIEPAAGAATKGALPAVNVSAEAERGGPSEGTGSYTTREVTSATRLALSMRETPQSVTIVTRQKIDDLALNTIEDVVHETPGLTLLKAGPERPVFYARGFQIDNLMYDGLPTADMGYLIPSANLGIYDRIEVVRGATGLMQGAGNPAASINLVRKKPTRESQFILTTSVGSWDNYRAEVDASGAINAAGTLRGRLVTSLQDKNSFQDDVKNKLGVFYGTLEADLGRDTTLSIGASRQRDRNRNTYGSLPTALNGSDLQLPRSTSLVNDWEHWNKTTTNYFADLEHRFGNEWKLRLAANKISADADYLGSYIYNVNNTYNVMGSRYAYQLEQESYDAMLTGPVSLFGRKHEVVFGASARSSVRTSNGAQGELLASNVDIYHWNASAVPAPTLADEDYYGETVRQKSMYATTRLNLADPLKLILGGRLDWYSYSDPTGDTQYKVSKHLSRYAGIIYDLNKQHSLYASYTDIFQPQSNQGLNGKLLDPIVGKNYEIGIKGEYFGGALNASAAVFQIDQTNRARAVDDQSICPTYPAVSCYEASGLVRSRGIELEMSGALTPNWQMAAGYTFAQAKYVKDATASRIGQLFDTDLPRSTFKLSTDYRFSGELSKWRAGANVYAQDGIYNRGTTFLVQQKGYVLVGLMAGYQATKNVDFQLNINNLFDKTYYQTLTTSPAYVSLNSYGAPRNFLLTMRTRF